MKKWIKIVLIILGIIMIVFLRPIIQCIIAGESVWLILGGIGMITLSMFLRAWAWGILLLTLSLISYVILGDKENENSKSKSIGEYCICIGVLLAIIPVFFKCWGIGTEFFDWLWKVGTIV